MKLIIYSASSLVLGLAILLATYLSFFAHPALGSSIPGLPARIATSSLQAMTTATVRLLFATSTDCAARIITTRTTDILLTFNDFQGDRPTNVSGHLQLASTTASYDSGIYGCGAVYVFPYGGTSLYVSETR